MPTTNQPTCLTPACGAPPYAKGRGLCLTCYGKAKSAVAKGTTSWDELAELGLAEPEQSKFEAALARRRAERAQEE